jgi:hypothetical protein
MDEETKRKIKQANAMREIAIRAKYSKWYFNKISRNNQGNVKE